MELFDDMAFESGRFAIIGKAPVPDRCPDDKMIWWVPLRPILAHINNTVLPRRNENHDMFPDLHSLPNTVNLNQVGPNRTDGQ